MGPYSSDTDEKMSTCKEAKRYLPATFAWVLLLSTTLLFFIFPAKWYVDKYSIWIPIGEALLAVVVVANFTLATFMDPGIIPKATRGEDDNDDLRAPLYKTVEVSGISVRMKWCVTCQFYRPPRCSHCSVCNNCIETFDHHCPWVNNCIGRRNYRFFFMFLMSLSFHMAAIFSLCLYYVLNHVDKMTEPTTIISIGIMVVIALLIIPIFGLTGFHVVLVSRGRTTNEQVTGKYRGGYNPFSKGCCYNCWFTLCGPQYPGLARAKRNAAAAHHHHHLAVVYQPPVGSTGGDAAYINSGSPSGAGNQVKTYIDNGKYAMKPMRSGNLPSLHSPRNYRQMLPASSRDDHHHHDHELGSQSLDCEPTPPMQRQGSKSNFFLPSNSMIDETPVVVGHGGRHMRGPYTHGSPHPNRQRNGDGPRSRSHTPDSSSSPSDPGTGGTMASPTLQQKIRAIGGVPTPFAASAASPMPRRSNPPTPTQLVRPDFIGLSHCGVSAAASSSSATGGHPAAHTQQQHVAAAAAAAAAARAHHQQPSVYYDSYHMNNNGEQRRFLSEGQLLYDRQCHGGGLGMGGSSSSSSGGGGLSGARDNNSGPIRELASSPQRGVYHWKDSSPTGPSTSSNFPPIMGNYFHSNPTSPIQHNIMMSNSATNSGGGGGGMVNSQQRVYYHHGVPTSHHHHPHPSSSPFNSSSSPPTNYLVSSSSSGSNNKSGNNGAPPVSPSMKKKYMSGIGGGVGGSGDDPVRPSPISRRPMSFVRALEMTDSMDLTNSNSSRGGGGANRSSPAGTPKGSSQIPVSDLSDRASVYDMNYEISV